MSIRQSRRRETSMAVGYCSSDLLAWITKQLWLAAREAEIVEDRAKRWTRIRNKFMNPREPRRFDLRPYRRKDKRWNSTISTRELRFHRGLKLNITPFRTRYRTSQFTRADRYTRCLKNIRFNPIPFMISFFTRHWFDDRRLFRHMCVFCDESVETRDK